MSEQKQPNLNQVLQSQKLLTEFMSLMGVINMLHNRIMAANLIPTQMKPPTNFSIPRSPNRGMSPMSPNWMEENMRQIEEASRGFCWPPQPVMGIDFSNNSPYSANMFAPGMTQPNILLSISQIFQLDPDMITVEKMEELKTDVEELQQKIMDMISAAVITDQKAE